MSPEAQQRIQIIRQKAADGTATLEDFKEAILLMRGDRKNAAAASEGARKRNSAPKAQIKSADDMLDELGSS